MKTASEIIEFAGRDRIMARIGVSQDAVARAARQGVIPAMWYDALENLCGRPLPRELFSFKGRKGDAA